MGRALTIREQGVLDKFSKFKLETIEADPVSFNSKGTMFSVKEPLVVKIGDTGALLVFGDLQKSMGMEELKAWLAAKMKEEENKPRKEEEVEREIDGDENSCGSACGHDEHQHTAVEDVPENDPRVSEEDIKLIMEQASVPREKVMETLKKCDYDVVNAMVMLSKDE